MTLVGMSNSRLACEGGLTPYKKNKKNNRSQLSSKQNNKRQN